MVAIVSVIIGCSCITAYLATYYGHNPSRAHGLYNDNYLSDLGSSEYDLLFDKPWFRWPSFISGTVAGYLIVIYEEKRFKLPWYYVLLGWCMSMFMAITSLYGIWGSYLGDELSQTESVFYITYSHTAWAIAVAWVPFACLSGNGGVVNTFLQWKFFIPFGRLTYNWYIIHPPLVAIYYYTLNRLFFYTNYSFVYLCISTLILIKAVAFLLHLLIDCPMQGIWVIIEKRLQKKPKYQ
ncbi:nose resistant to fluoxetine protein 6-like [Saccoglossus kowalevskii]|uniref:Nose resistant to fluoxetine protein 6-like n=1 Tax=Saccoglossus kowalevskii TaxID=10224 RepID=A0ABM0M296_SACKO|nr:PREDICTED: nose resistant to fluoxetine protein 6-like [Saccoglossus kowalevskii]